MSLPPGVAIRRAGLADVDALVRYRTLLLTESGYVDSEAGARALEVAVRCYLQEAIPSGQFLGWVAEAAGEVVATGGLVFIQRPPLDGNYSGLEAYAMQMYTAAEWRGRGIASSIMNEIVAYVGTTPATRIRLHANQGARSIYERAGFRATSTEMVLKLPVAEPEHLT